MSRKQSLLLLFICSLQVLEGHNEIYPELIVYLLQDKQAQFPQPFLQRRGAPALWSSSDPPLDPLLALRILLVLVDPLLALRILLVLGDPGLDAIPQIVLHKSWAEGNRVKTVSREEKAASYSLCSIPDIIHSPSSESCNPFRNWPASFAFS